MPKPAGASCHTRSSRRRDGDVASCYADVSRPVLSLAGRHASALMPCAPTAGPGSRATLTDSTPRLRPPERPLMSFSAVLGMAWIALHVVVAVPVIWVFVQTPGRAHAGIAPPCARGFEARPRRGAGACTQREQRHHRHACLHPPQLQPSDHILVVADNCNDDTAAVARAHGAQVIERQDTSRAARATRLTTA